MLGKIVLTVIMGCVGGGFAFVGIWLLVSQRRFAARALRTTGTVVDYETKLTRPRGQPTTSELYYPVFSFGDSQGQLRRVKDGTGSSAPSHALGTTVEVLYDPKNPQRAQIDSFGDSWLLPVLLSLGGVIVLGIPVYVWMFDVPVGLTIGGVSVTQRKTESLSDSGSRGPAPQPSAAAQAPVAPKPMVIAGVEPELAVFGEPITIRGSNFGARGSNTASLGGHGISVDLEIVDWKNDAVTVKIPKDARIRSGLRYWYRINRIENRKGVRAYLGGSNLFGFGFAAKEANAPVQDPAMSAYYKCVGENIQAVKLSEHSERLIAAREFADRLVARGAASGSGTGLDRESAYSPLAQGMAAYRQAGGTAETIAAVVPVPNPCAHLRVGSAPPGAAGPRVQK